MVEVATVLLAVVLLAFFFASEFVLELRPLVARRGASGGPGAWPPVGAWGRRARPAAPPLRRSRAGPAVVAGDGRAAGGGAPAVAGAEGMAEAGPEAAAEAGAEAAARAGRAFDGVCVALGIERPPVCPLAPEPAALRHRLAPIRPGAANVTQRHVATLGAILICCCANGGRGIFTRRSLAPAGLVVEDGALVSLRDRGLIEPVAGDDAGRTGLYDVAPDTPYRLTPAAAAALPGRFRAAMTRLGRLPG